MTATASHPTPATETMRFETPGFPERLELLAHSDAGTLVQVELEPGGGTPLHVHHGYAEHFEVLEGRVGIEHGGTLVQLGPGERITAPAEAPHRFVNSSDAPARFLVELRGGQRGFIDMQLVFFGLRADGLVRPDGSPKDPRHVAIVFGWARTSPPSRGGRAAMAVLRALGRLTGEERKLRARYVAPAEARVAALPARRA